MSNSKPPARAEELRYAAQLRALADSGIELSKLGHIEGGITCDCTGCKLVRAGMCLSCAMRLTAEIIQRGKPGNITVKVCSGTCAEALQQVFGEAKRAKAPKSEFLPVGWGPDDSGTPHTCEFEFVPSAKRPREIYVVFDGQRIAKRGVRLTTGEPGWIPLVEGFEVTDEAHDQLSVVFKGERLN